MAEDKPVTARECNRNVDDVKELIGNVAAEVKKHTLALYGKDGRNGIQKDVTIIKAAVENIEKAINGSQANTLEMGKVSAKKLTAYVTLVSIVITSIVAPVVRMLAEAIINEIFNGG